MHRDEEKNHIHLYNFLNDEHIECIHEDQNNFLPLNINLMIYLIPKKDKINILFSSYMIVYQRLFREKTNYSIKLTRAVTFKLIPSSNSSPPSDDADPKVIHWSISQHLKKKKCIKMNSRKKNLSLKFTIFYYVQVRQDPIQVLLFVNH